MQIEELSEKYYFKFQVIEKEYTDINFIKYLKKTNFNNEIINRLSFKDRFIKKYNSDKSYNNLVTILKSQSDNNLPNDIVMDYKKYKSLGYIAIIAIKDNEVIGFLLGYLKTKQIMDLYAKTQKRFIKAELKKYFLNM